MLNRGFTLIEMILVIFAVGLLLQGWYAFKNARLAEAAVERTVDGFVLIDEAAYAFHVEQGRWPNDLGELRATVPPLLPPPDPISSVDPLVNGVGAAYELRRLGSPPADFIEVETELQTDLQAASVNRAFPHRTRIAAPPDTNKVIYRQTADPGDQTEHELLVWRDDRGFQDAPPRGPGSIARELSFRDAVVAGDACVGKKVATAGTGELMECVGGQWRTAGAATGFPCGWEGWEIVDVFQEGVEWDSRWEINRSVRWWMYSGVAVGWNCSGGRVVDVQKRMCAREERARWRMGSYGEHAAYPWYDHRFTAADCGF